MSCNGKGERRMGKIKVTCELKDYSELICCENWTDCPYYKALMRGRYAELPKGTEKK